jgi:hypothetical protein
VVFVGDYGLTAGTYAIQAYAGSVAGYSTSDTAAIATGGTNNRQIQYAVNRGAGTITYFIQVTGYWAHVIAT